MSAYQKEFLTKMLFFPLDVPVCLKFGRITSSFLFQKCGFFFFFFSTEEDLYFLPASGIAMASTLCTPFSFSHLQPLLASSFHVPIPQLLHWHGFILPTCLHRRKSFSSREELLAYSYSFFLHGFLLCIT